ncbi:uncharacterized protein LOC111084989 [Limulus polyphemus]|uniref:Uncharacterized protein LOC111084989 n=1 Tax=Limulus polyphemus TaxID=6850 RepID=A0ABM1S1K6_LIMPO|nr:uncharacterized protein LOC111084989 [Limulus polyphemus]XP_022237512.1 uncharacterized protein LOC111084989 [Limulus polyphemus]XP_022237513.1 uncharacterized protein LOC111084989 [Limulus polyphemus]
MPQNSQVSDVSQGTDSSVGRCSFKRVNIGSNILIIVGLTLTLIGIAITLAGVFAEFEHTETRPIVLGIGPSLIGIGIFFLILRLLFWRPSFCNCCKKTKRTFSSENVTSAITKDRSATMRTTVKEEATTVGATPSGNADIKVKPALHSPNKTGTSGKAKTEANDVKDPKNHEAREINDSEQSSKENSQTTADVKFCQVESINSTQGVENENQPKTTRSSSMDFVAGFNSTIFELGFK